MNFRKRSMQFSSGEKICGISKTEDAVTWHKQSVLLFYLRLCETLALYSPGKYVP